MKARSFISPLRIRVLWDVTLSSGFFYCLASRVKEARSFKTLGTTCPTTRRRIADRVNRQVVCVSDERCLGCRRPVDVTECIEECELLAEFERRYVDR